MGPSDTMQHQICFTWRFFNSSSFLVSGLGGGMCSTEFQFEVVYRSKRIIVYFYFPVLRHMTWTAVSCPFMEHR